MYAFGDHPEPDEDAVSFLSGMTKRYLTDLVAKSYEIAAVKGSLDEECFLFVIKKDLAKFKRIKELTDRRKALEDELLFSEVNS